VFIVNNTIKMEDITRE